jgi:hypothetical protein
MADANGQPVWLPGASHDPHGEAGKVMPLWSAGLAGTDSSLCSSVPWHWGQAGTVPLRTRDSNAWPQPLQAYSKMGMVDRSVG